jgi:hypothetical protein
MMNINHLNPAVDVCLVGESSLLIKQTVEKLFYIASKIEHAVVIQSELIEETILI